MFELQEKIDIVKSVSILSLIFGILLYTGQSSRGLSVFGIVIGIAFLTVGISFILHEMAHKFVGMHYSCHTRFVSDTKMLLLGLFTVLFGFVFLIPGSVQISNVKSKKQMGIISAAGPLVNIVFSVGFLLAFLAFSDKAYSAIFFYGWFINGWLAMFNMLPFFGMDGEKVLQWNKPIFYLMLGISVALYLGQFLIQVAKIG